MAEGGGPGDKKKAVISTYKLKLCLPKLVIFPGNNDAQVIMQVHF